MEVARTYRLVLLHSIALRVDVGHLISLDGWNDVCNLLLLSLRELATGALQKAFADAAAVGRAGLVRELLTAQYPRLARIFEDTLAKVLQDTEVCAADSLHGCHETNDGTVMEEYCGLVGRHDGDCATILQCKGISSTARHYM